MTEVLLKKSPGGLEPASDEAYKFLSQIGVGAILVADIKDPRRRSSDQHRFFFAMANQLYQAQSYFKSFLHFRRALVIKLGHHTEYHLKDGTIYYEPDSLSFGKMSPAEFSSLVDQTLDFAETMGFDRNELLAYCRNEIPQVY